MSLILDGTNGVSDIDGSAATPAIRGTDTNTGIFFPAADTIAFSEGGVEAARFDSSGNLGVGTASPSSAFEVARAGADTQIRITESSDSGSNTALFYARRSRGTSLSSPTAIQSGNNMGGLAIGAYNGTAYAIGSRIIGLANQNWTGSAQGTNLTFSTTANGATSDTERMRINSIGAITTPDQPGWYVGRGTQTTVTGGATTRIPWNVTADGSVSGFANNVTFNTTTTAGRITIIAAGIYYVSVRIRSEDVVFGTCGLSITKNGTDFVRMYTNSSPAGPYQDLGQITALINCAVGDYLETFIAPANTSVISNMGNQVCAFSGYLLG